MEFKSKPRAYAASCQCRYRRHYHCRRRRRIFQQIQSGNSVHVSVCADKFHIFVFCRIVPIDSSEEHFCWQYCVLSAIFETIRVDTSLTFCNVKDLQQLHR